MKRLALSFPPTALSDNHYTYWLPPHADSTLLKPIFQYITLLWLSVTALTGVDLKTVTVVALKNSARSLSQVKTD